DGRYYRFDVASRQASPIDTPHEEYTGGPRTSGGPDRGRQYESAASPDSSHRAYYRDRNLWISNADGSDEFAVTTDGNDRNRVKYGTASWVYGEELAQNTAFWWSPDGKKLAFYRFDESKVPD